MLFDLYLPTRTTDSIEARVRTSTAGTVELTLGDQRTAAEPHLSYGGVHFHARVFEGLSTGTRLRVEARHGPTGTVRSLETETLDAAPGPPRLRVGILADLHLPGERTPIERYPKGTKRLPGLAHELATRYLPRLEALGADAIVLPGDLVDPCTPRTLGALREILQSVSVPCYPIIGNHEPWSAGGEALFYEGLGLPSGGYYVVRAGGVRLILLSTPAPDALGPGSAQLRWLEQQLAGADNEGEDVGLFAHFSLLLHPCVQGSKNDGYQLLDNRQELLDLIGRFPRVRVFAAGHKNVPSKVLHRGVVHLLSPQLIQAPCGFDMLTFYDGGLARTTYEIEEQHYCEVARAAYERIWPERYGREEDRNFLHTYR
jgi:hypothetical protein